MCRRFKEIGMLSGAWAGGARRSLSLRGMDLRDRVAVVVGGGGDIGVAVARRFSAEGARLVLAEDSAPSPARPAAASAGDPAAAETIALDLASEEEVRDAIAR